MKILFQIFFAFLLALCFSGCAQPSASAPDTEAPPVSSTDGSESTDVLIYGGPGTWRAEIESLKTILYNHGATYEEMSPSQINNLSLEDFGKYRAILFPGGDAPTVRQALTSKTRTHLREAVQKRGLNYLGFCAGAWLAVAPAPAGESEDVVYGIGVVDGPVLKINYLARQGFQYKLDNAIFPGGVRRKLLWYGGPITPEIPQGVVARYADGTPAITQISSGQGLVIISGLHPAANKAILSWLEIFESQAIAPEFAWQLLEAAIHHQPLPAF